MKTRIREIGEVDLKNVCGGQGGCNISPDESDEYICCEVTDYEQDACGSGSSMTIFGIIGYVELAVGLCLLTIWSTRSSSSGTTQSVVTK